MNMKKEQVLRFEQDAAFYNRRGRRMMQAGRFVEAVSNFRAAAERESNNTEFRLDLADALAEIDRFRESDAILFDIISEQGENCPECYYLLAMNQYAVGENQLALLCCKKYLELSPEGEYAEDAEDLAEALEAMPESEQLLESADILESRKQLTYANEMIYRGSYREAIDAYEIALAKDPTNTNTRINLALAYYCNGNLERAIELTHEVLERQSNNVHALCNMINFQSEQRNYTDMENYKKRLVKINIEAPEELHKVVFVMAEMADDAAAQKYAVKLLQYKPYEPAFLHACAAACYNLKEYDKAQAYWDTMQKADADDLVAQYYLSLVRRTIQGQKVHRRVSYVYQLPMEELVSNLRLINELAFKQPDEVKLLWRQDERLPRMVRWAMTMNDQMVKHALINLLAICADDKARQILKSILLDPVQTEELKQYTMLALQKMGEEGPFMMRIEGSVVEAMVTTHTEHHESFNTALEVLLASAKDRYEKKEEELCAVWQRMIDRRAENKRGIRNVRAFAAAVEWEYLTVNGKRANIRQLAQIYGVSTDSIRRYINQYSGRRED